MSRLHKADFCVNHAMSVNMAHTIPPDSEGYTVSKVGLSTTWARLLAFLEKPDREERTVVSFYSHTIAGHSTTISSVTRDGKRYVWYHNPWGYVDDLKYGQYDRTEAPDHETYDNAMAAQIEDIRKNVLVSNKRMYESNKIKMLGYRVPYMLRNYANRGQNERFRSSSIFDKYNHWRSRGIRNGEKLPMYHVMSILALLKFATDADHLVVIHPFNSMKSIGPQRDDGIDCFVADVIGGEGGACVLWSHVYMRRVHEVMTDVLNKRVAVVREADMLDIIQNELTIIPFGKDDHHQPNPESALAKYMDAYGGQKQWKTILSVVYDLLPEFAGQRPFRTTRLLAGENLHFHSPWHVEVLWKLDLVEKYVEEDLVRTYGTVKNANFKPEIVAGFVEMLYIVSSAAAKASLEYTENIGRITSFIVKSRLHKFEGVGKFSNMIKMLIRCKQNKYDLDERSRQSYSIPAPTRADRESTRTILQKHADTYGYGVTNGRFREDTRKKRRMTNNMHTKY